MRHCFIVGIFEILVQRQDFLMFENVYAVLHFCVDSYIFFKDDFLVEVDGDFNGSVSQLLPDSMCRVADGVDCPTETGGSVLMSAAQDLQDYSKERACDSLIMCIVTTLNQGLRNGGGIGDVLRAPSSKVSTVSITFIPITTRQKFSIRRSIFSLT